MCVIITLKTREGIIIDGGDYMSNEGKSVEVVSYPEVLLLEDLMQILHISRRSAKKLLTSGAIKAIKIGKFYRIPRPCLEEFMNVTYRKENT